MNRIKEYLRLMSEGVLNSYAQVFFSQNRYFGFFLMLVTFFSFTAGLSGLAAIIIVQAMAWFFNFSRDLVRDGTYTYNAMLTGVAVGSFYQLNISFLVLLVASSVLAFLFTLWYLNALGKKNLPVLTIPFLATVWVILLGASNFTALHARYESTAGLQELLPGIFHFATEFIAQLPFSNVLYLYFRSLGAILFQYNDVAGMIIAIGLVLNSRISFVLSVFGFVVGYAFYQFMEGDFSQLIYTYIGFNFILTAIALGGFFVVPSRRSFVNLLFTIPVIALLISAFHSFIYNKFGLPLYSLPFNLVVLLFVAAMQSRVRTSGLNLVLFQQFSPEKHHYNFYSNSVRYQRDTWVQVALPVMGEWYISQGHDGAITHKKGWQHAWDFDVRDDMNQTFQGDGTRKEDYYCFGLPVLSPADGVVVELEDGIEDNEIGQVNLERNWGNAIVIKHADYLYSKLSHFKMGSFKVKVGDSVRKGDVIGFCGSSGRSPEPHLHFQFQSTPYIGSQTMQYPFSFYISKQNHAYKFHSYEIPAKGDRISNLRTTRLLTYFFGFIPGQRFRVSNGKGKTEVWEIQVSPYNQTYIWCAETRSIVWYVNNGSVFYCSSFEGDRTSFLYTFFLAVYKVPLGYYPRLSLSDHISILNVSNYFARFIHDFTAPFFHYLKAQYNFRYVSIDNEHDPEKITFVSEQNQSLFGQFSSKMYFRTTVKSNGLTIEAGTGEQQEVLTCEPVS
ncbi:MAG: urea transporter [Bacteroidia bacterium]